MRDVRVPKARAEFGAFKVHVDRPLFHFPPFGMLASGVAAVMMGAARASIRELTALASVKIPEAHRRVLAQRTQTQEDLAEAEAQLRSARAFYFEMMGKAWDETKAKGRASTETRRDLRLAITHAARSSVRAVDLMYNLGGGTFQIIILFDTGRDTPSIIQYTDRVIRVKRHGNIIAMSGQCFINRIIDYFKNHVV